MLQPPLLLATINQLWYALPLIVAICLVYSATRHELAGPILVHAGRLGLWITGFMGVVLGILSIVSWRL